MKGIGVDIESVGKFRELYKDKKFLETVFTKREIEHCKSKKEPWICFTGKFCAREAVIKAVSPKSGVKSIEIISKKDGSPEIFIKGIRQRKILCTISHTEDYAVAFAVAG